MTVRILIADDHKILREGLKSLLEKQPEFAFVAEAQDGLSAISEAKKHKPDIAILDIGMPDLNGIEVTRRIRSIAETVVKNSLEKLDRKDEGSSVLLSGREREVLQMIAEGKSTKEIALKLFVSTKTVETHRKQIMDKLNIRTVAGLTKYAIREGLTSLG